MTSVVPSGLLLLLVHSTSANPAGCECTGVNTGINTATYGSNYGTSCAAWEDGGNFTSAPSCDTYSDVGTWCCRPWCYINPATCDGLWIRAFVARCGRVDSGPEPAAATTTGQVHYL